MDGMLHMLEEQEVKTIYEDSTVLVVLEGIGSDDMVAIHVEALVPFTKPLYEQWLLKFEDLKVEIDDMGYSFIMTAYHKPDVKIRKFWEMFGFEVFVHGQGMIAFMPTEV